MAVAGRGKRPWHGPNKCLGETAGGSRCSDWEIDGLEFCIHHVPDEMLDEAEEITGLRRCRAPGGCPLLAKEGTDPARCMNHAGPPTTVKGQLTTARAIEGQVIERMEEILAAGGDRLLNPAKIEDPFTELLNLAAEIKAFKDMLREHVSMRRIDQMTYRGKVAEQIRGEVVLYERALERLERILVNILKLGIEDRLAGVEEKTLELMERALETAIKAGVAKGISAGNSLAGEAEAREVLRRELPVLAA
jgi:hypothetical protein